MTPKTEQTKKTMYAVLDRIRRARKHVALTSDFEIVLEAHLEAVRQEFVEGISRLAAMTEERDQIQLRLHAVDHAFKETERALGIAGDTIRAKDALIVRQRAFIGEMVMEKRGIEQ